MTDHTPPPCRTTQHCAYHGWCHRCDPAFAAVMSAVNAAVQRTDSDESHWGPLYAAVGKALHRKTEVIEHVVALAERWENALAPDRAYARSLRAALDGAEQPAAAPAIDRAALRDPIAAALYERERPPRDPHWPDAFAADREVFEAMADAVLAVLPPVSRADVLREAADIAEDVAESLRKHHEFERSTGALDVMTELRRMADEEQPATETHRCGTCEGVDPGTCLMNPDRPRGDTRPRCPHCQMPHDLTPDMQSACASIRASIADAAVVAEQPAANAGPGWYEVINPRNATTNITYVHEDGSLYLPEGDALTEGEFAFAAARGHAHRLVRADDAEQPAAGPAQVTDDDEGDELVCVDMCGSCDACGMEPFGTPAEGWREAARFLRRRARASGNRQGALHGAQLIEDELRRRHEAEQLTDSAPQAEQPAAADRAQDGVQS